MKDNVFLWRRTNEVSCGALSMKKLFALFLLFCFAFSAQSVLANDPGAESDNGVQPIFYSGNPTCSTLMGNIEGLMEFRINEVGDGMFGDENISINLDVQPDNTFDWDVGSGVIIQSIFVKGGPAGNLYEYYSDGGVITKSDGSLHSPVNPKNGNYYGLSHISFCYTPGEPDIELTKSCEFDNVVNGNALKYNYGLKVENTGTLPLFDIKVIDTTAEEIDGEGTHTYTLDELAPGGTHTFNGTFIIGQNGVLNKATVTAAIEDNGEVAVDDMASWDCPEQNLQGTLSLEKDCNVVVVLNDYGNYGLQVNYSGEVCNTSEVTINDVFVTDDKDAVPQFIGTLTPKGTIGACASYSGSYIPVPGEDELGDKGTPGFYVRAFKDMVTATGVPVFGNLDTVTPAEAECTLCPQCADLDMCPAPAIAPQ